MAADAESASARTAAERVIRVRVAGFPRRMAAAVLDLATLLALTATVTIGVAMALKVPFPQARELSPDLLLAAILDRSPIAVSTAGIFVGLWALYQIYFNGISGQTLGKRLLGIRVISVRGGAPGPARGILRLAVLAICIAPAGLGWLWALFDRENRALHDHLAGTYVILDR